MLEWPERGSNPHTPYGIQDFKSCASANFATRPVEQSPQSCIVTVCAAGANSAGTVGDYGDFAGGTKRHFMSAFHGNFIRFSRNDDMMGFVNGSEIIEFRPFGAE